MENMLATCQSIEKMWTEKKMVSCCQTSREIHHYKQILAIHRSLRRKKFIRSTREDSQVIAHEFNNMSYDKWKRNVLKGMLRFIVVGFPGSAILIISLPTMTHVYFSIVGQLFWV
jgi:hypothetical protein